MSRPSGAPRAVDRSRFFRNAIRLSLLGQLPPAFLLYRLLTAAGVPLPALVLLALLAWLNLGLLTYIRHAFPERSMHPFWKYAFVLPFFVYYFAAGLLLLPAGVMLPGYALELFFSASSGALDLFAGILWISAIGISSYACLVRRPWVRISRLELSIPDLPGAFEGFQIVQLSDLHVGNFAGQRALERWVRLANREEPDLVVITGDLVNSGEAFVGVLAAGLGKLRAKEGVVVSLGNHDYFGQAEVLPEALFAAGLEVLRNEGRPIRRGEAAIYLAAVDDTWSRRADLERTLRGRPDGMPVVLLSHDPLLFPTAASRGVALTLSGHTHGGQLAVPFYGRLNLSSRVYPYTVGWYQIGGSSLYVHRGLGTTGPPVRLGAAPEIAVITLKRAP